jgi:hypothetical protein
LHWLLGFPPELLLHIPRAAEIGNQRVEFTHATAFAEALNIIYETIGCADLTRKPDLTYKLTSATAKTASMGLNSATDWKGCLEDVRQVENSKKAGTVIAVNIFITEQVRIIESIMIHTSQLIGTVQSLAGYQSWEG